VLASGDHPYLPACDCDGCLNASPLKLEGAGAVRKVGTSAAEVREAHLRHSRAEYRRQAAAERARLFGGRGVEGWSRA
jgi:hypothetical protein